MHRWEFEKFLPGHQKPKVKEVEGHVWRQWAPALSRSLQPPPGCSNRKRDYQPSASCYIILVGIAGSHLSVKPIPWMGAFPEHIKNSFPKFLFPWWWISSKSITTECVTLLPPCSHHQIWTAQNLLELCFWLMLYLTCSRESSWFLPFFPAGSSTDSWFRAMGQCVPVALLCTSCLWLPQFSLSLSKCLVIPCHPHPRTSVSAELGSNKSAEFSQSIHSSSGTEVTQVKMKKVWRTQFWGWKTTSDWEKHRGFSLPKLGEIGEGRVKRKKARIPVDYAIGFVYVIYIHVQYGMLWTAWELDP